MGYVFWEVNITHWVLHFCTSILFSSEYLQQESKDKKGKELDTLGWILHSKTRNVSSTDKVVVTSVQITWFQEF